MKRLLAITFLAVATFASCTSSTIPSPPFAETLATVACGTPPSPPPTIEGPQKESLRLVAVGDTGLPGQQLSETLAAMRAVGGIDATLLLGDNVYECGVRGIDDPEWTSVIAPLLTLGKPVYPVLGNHDWGSRAIGRCGFSSPMAEIAKSGEPGFEQWIFPGPNYVVNTPAAEIILFDSSPIAEGWPEDLQRSLCALRAALARPKETPWRIVVAHHPLFSCGMHGAEEETVRMRQAVETLLQESRVDLYVSGHDHDLEIRSEPPGPPVYLVSGSGSKIRKHGATCDEGLTFRIVGGFAVLDVTAETLSLRVFCNGQASPCMTKSLSRADLGTP